MNQQKRRAEIVFRQGVNRPKGWRREDPTTHLWRAEFVARHDTDVEIIDGATSAASNSVTPYVPSGFICRIESIQDQVVPELEGPIFNLIIQGRHPSARRYSTFRNLTDAQTAATRWARRRFYLVPTDGALHFDRSAS